MSAEMGAKSRKGSDWAATMSPVDMLRARMMGTSKARIIGTS